MAVPAAPAVPVVPAAPAPVAAPAAAEAPPSRIPLRPGDRVEDPSRLRVRIAEHMVENRRTAAHVWTAVEADFEVVERVRRRHLEAFKAREGFSLTYLPFIARATVDALNAFPVVNSSFYLEEKKVVMHGAVNLGIAVDMDQRGLIVMNLPNADGMRLRELARRIRAVAEKARSGNLTPDDVVGSTFTITNPGPYGSLMSAPIINVPEVAILSTDTVVKRPVVVTDATGADAIAVHHVGYLGLTWDHRAFDGATAVLFLRKIKDILETRDWEQELA
jgi:2-oxoglutarate dehydrogenase E2 component (dihydrolipoamide succinyltransferase)